MTASSDLPGDMNSFPSAFDADRLLSGSLDPDDVPRDAIALTVLLFVALAWLVRAVER